MEEGRESTQRRPATERADELLSRAGQTAGIFASLVGMRVARVAAFAREEVEDMWAEARSIRQQAAEAEANGDVKASASEGVNTSERSRGETEKREPEERTETGGEAEAGATTAEATDHAIKPGDYVGAAGRKEEEQDTDSGGGAEEIKATDAAQRRAEELGVDLRDVEGTGAHGQITVEDVKKKA